MNALANANIKDNDCLGLTSFALPEAINSKTGVSEDIFKIGMCLPSGPCVANDDVKYIVETIKSAIE